MNPADPLIVSRFDVAIEPAPEEDPVLTIGAIAEDGRPVALFFDPETRAKVGNWLMPSADRRADTECDGSTHKGTRNCEETAVWSLRLPGEAGEPSQACGQHLNQVATYLLDGEQGDVDVRRIATVE